MPNEPTYLDRNENNYGPAPACYEALKSVELEFFSWYSKDFVRGVKSTLSERLAGDYGLPESTVLLGYGGEDLLKQTVHCYLHPGQTLMIPTHSWWYYKSIAAETGGLSVEYPLRPGAESYIYDVQALLDQAASVKPSVILISSPNNPTGNSLGLSDLRKVLASVPESVVVLDEAYWGFTENPQTYVKELIRDFPNLLIIRTFSKYYALAGLRIGFAFLGRGLKELGQFSARYLGYNRLSERLALAALDSEAYYLEIRRRMSADKEAFYQGLNDLPGYKAFRSDANFILAEVPPADAAALKACLTGKGLIIKFLNERFLENTVRITIGTQAQNKALLEAIQAFAREKGCR